MSKKYEKNPIILGLIMKKGDFYNWKWIKKGDFENPKVINCDFSKVCPIENNTNFSLQEL